MCALLPIQADKVVFASARAEKLEGNLLYIHREMLQQLPDLRYVLLLERYSYSFVGKVAYLLRLTRGAYHLATARLFIVDNAYLPIHLGPHRSGTTVVQVWHAAGALKKFGLDIDAAERAVENRFVHRYYDRVVVDSAAAVAPYATALRTDSGHVVPLGTARTDMFFDERAVEDARARFFDRYPAFEGKRILLYAPTFRGHGVSKRPGGGLDARALRDRLGDDWVLVHKVHPVFGANGHEGGFDLEADDQFDLNELFCVADVFVTDYSSAVFEWTLLKKPLVLFVDDLAIYERDPGFYLDFRSDMVGSFAETSEQVADLVARDAWDLSAYDSFVERFCPLDDGHASERVVGFLRGFLG